MDAGEIYVALLGMGLGKGYASQLARKKRQPSLRLSLKILKVTGIKLGPLNGASAKEVASLRRVAERQERSAA